jgi:predicted ester cyclase
MTRTLFALFFLTLSPPTMVLLVSAPAAATEIHCDGQRENLNTYLNMFDVLFLQRDGSRAGEFYAAEFISHNADAGGSDTTIGQPAQLEAMFKAGKAASPDRTLVNDVIICKDDIVSTRMTVTGTQTGVMMGNPPTGRKFKFTAMDIFRFKDGKVVERWGNSDSLIIIRQLGLDVDLSLQPLKE